MNDSEKYLIRIIELLERKNEKAVLNLDETSAYTGMGRTRLLEIINKNNSDFPYFRNGKKILVNKQMLDKWLEKQALEHKAI